MCLYHDEFNINNMQKCSHVYTNIACFLLNCLNQESDRKTVSLWFVTRELYVWGLWGLIGNFTILKTKARKSLPSPQSRPQRNPRTDVQEMTPFLQFGNASEGSLTLTWPTLFLTGHYSFFSPVLYVQYIHVISISFLIIIQVMGES